MPCPRAAPEQLSAKQLRASTLYCQMVLSGGHDPRKQSERGGDRTSPSRLARMTKGKSAASRLEGDSLKWHMAGRELRVEPSCRSPVEITAFRQWQDCGVPPGSLSPQKQGPGVSGTAIA